jgi:hypothetical protein
VAGLFPGQLQVSPVRRSSVSPSPAANLSPNAFGPPAPSPPPPSPATAAGRTPAAAAAARPASAAAAEPPKAAPGGGGGGGGFFRSAKARALELAQVFEDQRASGPASACPPFASPASSSSPMALDGRWLEGASPPASSPPRQDPGGRPAIRRPSHAAAAAAHPPPGRTYLDGFDQQSASGRLSSRSGDEIPLPGAGQGGPDPLRSFTASSHSLSTAAAAAAAGLPPSAIAARAQGARTAWAYTPPSRPVGHSAQPLAAAAAAPPQPAPAAAAAAADRERRPSRSVVITHIVG